MEELLNEIDELLVHFEDFTHGKEGQDITRIRGKIALALRQYNGSLPHGVNIEEKEPHEVSTAKCNLCGKEWVAVRPKGLTELECPNCKNMVQFENV